MTSNLVKCDLQLVVALDVGRMVLWLVVDVAARLPRADHSQDKMVKQYPGSNTWIHLGHLLKVQSSNVTYMLLLLHGLAVGGAQHKQKYCSHQ